MILAVCYYQFEVIDHNFLTSGHTYLPSDQDFALIEKKKKGNEVFIPTQWFSLVESTRTKKPFQVARIQREDFKSLKTFSKKFVNRKKTADKEQLSFQKIDWFHFSKSEPTKVLVHHTLQEEEPLKVWNIGQKGVKYTSSQLLKIKYSADNPINYKKLKDLKKIKPFILKAYHPFYDNLTSSLEDMDTDAEYIDSD